MPHGVCSRPERSLVTCDLYDVVCRLCSSQPYCHAYPGHLITADAPPAAPVLCPRPPCLPPAEPAARPRCGSTERCPCSSRSRSRCPAHPAACDPPLAWAAAGSVDRVPAAAAVAAAAEILAAVDAVVVVGSGARDAGGWGEGEVHCQHPSRRWHY